MFYTDATEPERVPERRRDADRRTTGRLRTRRRRQSTRSPAADGSVVYFTDGDAAGLTADTVAGSGTNLYAYNIDERNADRHDRQPGAAEVDGVARDQQRRLVRVLRRRGRPRLGGDRGPGEPVRRSQRRDRRSSRRSTATTAPTGTASTRRGSPPTARTWRSIRRNSLTGYDNTDANTGGARTARSSSTTRPRTASCALRATRPAVTADRPLEHRSDRERPASGGNTYLSHNLSDDGSRLFFDRATPSRLATTTASRTSTSGRTATRG